MRVFVLSMCEGHVKWMSQPQIGVVDMFLCVVSHHIWVTVGELWDGYRFWIGEDR